MVNILKPPTFENEEKSHQAFLLHVIVWGMVFVPVPYLVYTLALSPQDFGRALAQSMFGEFVNFLVLLFMRRGFVKESAIFQMIMLWIFFTITSFSANGVRSEAYVMGYPLVIIIAGILFSGRAASYMTALSLLTGMGMVYAEAEKLIPANGNNTPVNMWVISLVIFPMIAVLQYLSSNSVQNALKRATISQKKYMLLSNISTDYVFETSVDEQGVATVFWVGGAFEKMTGYTLEEYLAAGSWPARVYPEDVEKDNQDMEILSKNQDVKSELRTITKSGEIRWERIFAHPIWDENKNRLAGIIGAVQDITDIKNAEETLKVAFRQTAEMIRNIPDMAWLKDANSRYIAVNEKFAEVAGHQIETIIGKTDFEIWGEDFAQKYRDDDLFVMETQKLRRVEEKQQDRTGREYWVETIKTPIFNGKGEVAGTTGVARDINERKEAELTETRRREMLEKVIELGKLVTETSDLKGTISKIWHGVHDDLQFDRLAIFLYNPERNQMDDTLGTDEQGQMVDNYGISFPVGRGADGSTFASLLERPDGFYFTHNYAKENNIPPEHEMHKVREYAAVAAWAGNKPVAVICVDNLPSERPIADEQLEGLRLFAGYAGLAIENTRLNTTIQNELLLQKRAEQREARRRATLEKVIKLGQSVTEVHTLRSTLERIWHGVHDELGFDRLAIFLYNVENNSLDGSLGTSDDGLIVEEWDYSHPLDREDESSFTITLERPDGLYFTKNFGVEHNIREGHEMHDVKDYAAVAAWAGDKPVAIISVDNLPSGRQITEEQLEALRLFGGYAGLAIENARLSETIQKELIQRKAFIQELEAKNAELERFTYTVSHDLKSPLVTIRGFLGYLEQDATSGRFDKFRQDITRIETAVVKMQNLLRDLLDLSRVGRLINPPTEVSFNEIVKDALEIVHGQIEGRSIVIVHKEANVVINCDRVRMTEVMQNLIENSIKFMGDQTSPRIEIGSFKDETGKTIFYVKDNGVGIAPEFQEKIFGLFNKLSTDSTGTGIGLALVKRIIEVHGGQIWVESQIGRGAAFYFTLP